MYVWRSILSFFILYVFYSTGVGHRRRSLGTWSALRGWRFHNDNYRQLRRAVALFRAGVCHEFFNIFNQAIVGMKIALSIFDNSSCA